MLLGTVQGGIVEVTNSFGVHHVKREGEVLVRRTAVLDLLALHKKINSKEVVVGWCVCAQVARGQKCCDIRTVPRT